MYDYIQYVHEIPYQCRESREGKDENQRKEMIICTSSISLRDNLKLTWGDSMQQRDGQIGVGRPYPPAD